jgi:hypothetical protein
MEMTGSVETGADTAGDVELVDVIKFSVTPWKILVSLVLSGGKTFEVRRKYLIENERSYYITNRPKRNPGF